MGLPKGDTKPVSLTEKQRATIVKLYLDRLEVKMILERYGISNTTLGVILREAGVSKRSRKP
jgi:hypothetical protein